MNKVQAKDHESYTTFTILSLLIPIAGFIIGIVFMTKSEPLDRKVGEHALTMSVLFSILWFLVLSFISF